MSAYTCVPIHTDTHTIHTDTHTVYILLAFTASPIHIYALFDLRCEDSN